MIRTGAEPAVALRPCARSVLTALDSGRGVLVVGPAGAGKTHTLRAVADRLRGRGERVRQVRATSSIAAVPFGVLLPLLPVGAPMPASATGIAAALLTLLVEEGAGVLLVDDAHLFDGPSAGVLHQAATAGLRFAATARDDEDQPDAVARLVLDVGAEPVAVGRLEPEETAGMLRGLLGGSVDDRLAHVVHERSAGLPLAVDAIVRSCVSSGAILDAEGEWRLGTELPAALPLGSLMRHVMVGLSPEARRAAELVAITEGLTEAEVDALGLHAGVEEGELRAVLAWVPDRTVALAHPLYADALLGGLPSSRRRTLLGELLDALGPPIALPDRMRAALWALELGRPVAAPELLALVGPAATTRPRRAILLARAAVDAGASVQGRLALAEVLAHEHRAEEAQAVLAELDTGALEPGDAVPVELTRGFLLNFALGRPEEARDALDGLPDLPPVLALRTSVQFYLGRIAEAAADARVLARQDDLPSPVRAHAALTAAGASETEGDATGFAAWLPLAQRLVEDVRESLPEGAESLRMLVGLNAARNLVDPVTTGRLARAGYRRSLERGEDGERAQWAYLLAEAALLGGDPVEAVRLLRGSLGTAGRWQLATTGMTRSALIRALALSGDRAGAGEELARLRGLRVLPVQRVDVALAEAEVAAGALGLRCAGATAEAAARTLPGRTAEAWYAALRFGRAGAATMFLAAAADAPGDGRAAQRDHARAVLGRDARGLEAASQRLDAAGLALFAVDAMAHAVRAFHAADPVDSAPLERLHLLTARFPALRSPLAAASGRPVLTAREIEVARRIADGASARSIAAELGVGVRTVESHAAHLYRKLGVHSRAQLHAALALSAARRNGPA